MTRATHIRYLGEAEGHGRALSILREAGDAVLDRRSTLRALVVKCPDGCGEVLTVNLDPRSGKAWRLHVQRGKLTLYPSVWRDSGCRSHFILWRDRLLWCDRHDSPEWDDEALVREVEATLQRGCGQFWHYDELATSLSAVPWEVLWACQRLVSRGRAMHKDRVHFRAAAGATSESVQP